MKQNSRVPPRVKRGTQLPRVLLTRADGQNEELAEALRANGVEAVIVPVLEVAVDAEAVKRAFKTKSCDWVVVTSPNGAKSVAGKLPRGVKVAAVGAHTATALGAHVDLVPDVTNSEGLVAAFPNAPDVGGCVIVCRSDLADDTVVDGLAKKGWTTFGVVTYSVTARDSRTLLSELQSAGHIDAIVVASGSAARALPEAPVIPPVISIGPKTTKVAESLGLNVIATAETQDLAGLLSAVLRAVR